MNKEKEVVRVKESKRETELAYNKQIADLKQEYEDVTVFYSNKPLNILLYCNF